MPSLANLKTAYKLGILMVIALLALGFIGFTGYYYLKSANQAMNSMYANRLVPVKLTNEVRSNVRAMNGAVLESMLTSDEKVLAELNAFIDQRSKQVGDFLTEVGKAQLDPKAKDLLEKANTYRQSYRDVRVKVSELVKQNNRTEAYALYAAQAAPLARDYTDALRELADYLGKAAEQANRDNDAEFVQAAQISTGIILVALILLVVSGWLISRTITKPLGLMVTVCGELAAGDFREKTRQVLRQDEIGQLADALAQLRGNMRALLKGIHESSEQVAASSEELSASAEQSAQASHQVAGSVAQTADDAQKQSVEVEKTIQLIEQVNHLRQKVAKNAGEVTDGSEKAAEASREGKISVGSAMDQMKNLVTAVNNSVQVVSKLGDRSKEIGQIVDTIAGIAGQTNLLALNAAIEAARAGAQGRGFAVVAEEVRKLAEQSQEAAKQISTLIANIQEDTNQAVASMNTGSQEAKQGTQIVNQASEAFDKISRLIDHAVDLNRQSIAARKEMAEGNKEIDSRVHEVDQMSRNIMNESQSISAATEQQLASMEEIASASEALAKLAQSLQTAVAKFQL